MEITLNKLTKVSDLQSEFGRAFPYLRIEFYNIFYRPKVLWPKSKMCGGDMLVSNCIRKHHDGITWLEPAALRLNSKWSVLDFEYELWHRFGLSSKIFRRSGNLWIATTLTSSWTLEHQNQEGEQMSTGTAVN